LGKSPCCGYRLRDFSLCSSEGRDIGISDYRGRSNLVLIFGGVPETSAAYLEVLSQHSSAVHDEGAEVLAVLECTREAAINLKQASGLLFPVLADIDTWVHRQFGAHDASGRSAAALYVADKFGQVLLADAKVKMNLPPDMEDIVKTLQFIEGQCPECEPPEWPLQDF
jgi:peroxiredoxin